ncbi:hypothetical protein OBBRIDRAFT_889144 [Obba rivulosa]|uniref:Uncharacterized protein n=1 Tax=Obba rivulosa TaxID=1052685 RepID=A0A8E2DK15_9APHY|nr:hypothetical protein OBBRIDRAFT_889144 [Obba rivulosa]
MAIAKHARTHGEGPSLTRCPLSIPRLLTALQPPTHARTPSPARPGLACPARGLDAHEGEPGPEPCFCAARLAALVRGVPRDAHPGPAARRARAAPRSRAERAVPGTRAARRAGPRAPSEDSPGLRALRAASPSTSRVSSPSHAGVLHRRPLPSPSRTFLSLFELRGTSLHPRRRLAGPPRPARQPAPRTPPRRGPSARAPWRMRTARHIQPQQYLAALMGSRSPGPQAPGTAVSASARLRYTLLRERAGFLDSRGRRRT